MARCSTGKMVRKGTLFDQGLRGARLTQGTLVGREVWRTSFNL